MSKRFFQTKYLLVVILLLASVLRLWQLGAVPPSPDWDEAALGYNAYSLLQTGKDEYGNFLPVVLRSFDDYKPALYAYILIPFIKVLGLTLFAVRLPSALVGIAAVGLTYFLAYELTKNKYLSLLASLLLAISPWHIQFSRTAFEASSAVFLNMLMAFFFLKGLKRPWLLSLSTISAGLSTYMYQSEKIFTPLLFLLLLVVYFQKVRTLSWRYTITALLIGSLVILPMGLYIVQNAGALNRATNTVSFADEKQFLRENSLRELDDTTNRDLLGKIVDNRRLVYVNAITKGYLSHFDLKWLFLTGDADRHHAPGMSLLYLFELPLLLLGIYYFIFSEKTVTTKILILGWILLTPIPASVGSDVPHAVRTINFLPMLQVVCAGGVIEGYYLLKKLRKQSIQYAVIGACVLFILFNLFYYLNQYFVQLNYFYSKDWQYGYQQMARELQKIQSQYTRVVISERPPMDQSYIFTLFYLKYPPASFQKAMQLEVANHYDHRMVEKYEFRSIDWQSDQYAKETLFIGTPKDFPDSIRSVYTITYLNGETAMKFVSPKDLK